MLFSNKVRIRVRVRIRLSVWLVSCYAHVFVLFSIIIVTLPFTHSRFSITFLISTIAYFVVIALACRAARCPRFFAEISREPQRNTVKEAFALLRRKLKIFAAENSHNNGRTFDRFSRFRGKCRNFVLHRLVIVGLSLHALEAA